MVLGRCRVVILLAVGACGRIGFGPLSGENGASPNDGDSTATDGVDALAGINDAPSSADGGLSTDAGSSVDAAAGAVENDNCVTAIGFSGDQAFSGTTCGANDTILAECGTAGTPDVFYYHDAMVTTSYQITITNGFLTQLVDRTGCVSEAAFYCETGTSTIGIDGRTYFAIERTAGGCGAYTVTFNEAPY